MRSKIYSLVILLSFAFGKAFGGGFQINEHGARAMAMGGAFTGLANDPSAVYFNAAGITQLNGTQFMLGTTMITPDASFRGVYPSVTEYDLKKQSFFPSHFWATHKVNNDLSVGIGFTTPFGLGTDWGDNWVGKYLAIKTDLTTFTVTPVVAYKVLDNLSLSAGFVYSWATVNITQKTSQTPFKGDAFVSLDGKDNSAFGFNVSAFYKPMSTLSFGVSFHSQIKYDFKGTATTTGAQQLIDAKKLPEGDVTAKLTTPTNLTFGIAYRVIPKLQLSFDFQYVGWSSYDTLAIDFSDKAYSDIASPRLYDNSYILRLGGEYQLLDQLAVEAGIYFDKNPVKPEYLNPSLPDADRLGFSFGLNYKITNSLAADAAYLFIRGKQLTVSNSQESYTSGFAPFNGTYTTSASLLSLSLSYSL